MLKRFALCLIFSFMLLPVFVQAQPVLQPHYGPNYYFDGQYYYYQDYYCTQTNQCFYYTEGQYYEDVEGTLGTSQDDTAIFKWLTGKTAVVYQYFRQFAFVAAGIGAFALIIMAFFGKFKWTTFFSLIGGLIVIAGLKGILEFITEEDITILDKSATINRPVLNKTGSPQLRRQVPQAPVQQTTPVPVQQQQAPNTVRPAAQPPTTTAPPINYR